MAQAIGNTDETAFGLWILGTVAVSEKRNDEAAQLLGESLTIYQKHYKSSYIGRAQSALGSYYLAVGNENKAKQYALEALGIGIEVREPLTAVTQTLPPEVAATALKRGEEMDLWETAVLLLAEMDGS